MVVARPRRLAKPPRLFADDSPFSSKSLRTARGWKNRKKPKKSEAARRNTDDRRSAENSKPKVPWGRHDSLWIAEVKEGRDAENQFIDLQAQVGLFLLQTDSVPNDGEVRDRLVEYLRSTFRWRGAEEPDADVYVVYNHLLKHKWWLDDRRGWRKLVRACINGVIKSQRRRGARDRDLAADDQGRLTVDQFARRCGMSRSKAYALIRAGTVPTATMNGDRRCMIAESVAQQVGSVLRRPTLIDALVKQGRSLAAARKWVQRQEGSGLSLAAIAAKAAASNRSETETE